MSVRAPIAADRARGRAARASSRRPATRSSRHRARAARRARRRARRDRGLRRVRRTRSPRSRRWSAGRRASSGSTRRDACACTASACAGCARPAGRSTCGNAGTLLRLLAGHPGRPARARSRSTATSRSAAAPSTASPTPLRRMGARARTATACRRCDVRGGRPLQPITLRAAGGLGAGQVVRAARGAVRRERPDDGGRADADARPHRAHAAPRRACASTGGRRASRSGRPSASRWPRRGAGRHLVGRAVHRRRDAAGGVAPVPARRRRQPDAHRPADGARAHGRAHRALQPAHAARAASRSPTSRCGTRRAGRHATSSPSSCRRWSTSCR